MHAFSAGEQGYTSALETWEREYLAGLLEQVADILAEPGHGPHGDGTGVPRPPGAPRAGESQHDADVLAALDFEAAIEEEGHGRRPAVEAALASVLDVLLPDACEDPGVAVEIAGMVRDQLRHDKRGRLLEVAAQLREPSGADGAVLVRRGQEATWLGALNDVRLVLAERLGIDSAEAAHAAHATAWQDPPADEDDQARWRRAIALSYDMLTWWHESLVTVVLDGEDAA
ncbi:MAG: DUF2017 family protein [Actinomyces sp.]|uniref:DUF2017 family protein n=1 Tax=Actinomyces sp. TaxID=29317 RepID=UPI0026DCDB8A|nr:DUF2017 family protein [Actinomyces sp.]MDO4243384.1 DUF2017 family protein [Actinomyces sp.]